jgi:hypothetical protein
MRHGDQTVTDVRLIATPPDKGSNEMKAWAAHCEIPNLYPWCP